MPKFDVAEVQALLSIPALVANNVPWATHINSEAMARLREIETGLIAAKAEAKKAKEDATSTPAPTPGQPVANPTPSTPIEPPKSTVAQQAPVERVTTGGIPTRNIVGGVPGPAELTDPPATIERKI